MGGKQTPQAVLHSWHRLLPALVCAGQLAQQAMLQIRSLKSMLGMLGPTNLACPALPATQPNRCPRELARRVEKYVLRRTREVNSRYLPPLSNYVVFCRCGGGMHGHAAQSRGACAATSGCVLIAGAAPPVAAVPLWPRAAMPPSSPLLPLPCRPTEVQLRLYSSVLGSGVVRKMLSATGSDFGDTVSAGL